MTWPVVPCSGQALWDVSGGPLGRGVFVCLGHRVSHRLTPISVSTGTGPGHPSEGVRRCRGSNQVLLEATGGSHSGAMHDGRSSQRAPAPVSHRASCWLGFHRLSAHCCRRSCTPRIAGSELYSSALKNRSDAIVGAQRRKRAGMVEQCACVARKVGAWERRTEPDTGGELFFSVPTICDMGQVVNPLCSLSS